MELEAKTGNVRNLQMLKQGIFKDVPIKVIIFLFFQMEEFQVEIKKLREELQQEKELREKEKSDSGKIK